MQVLAPYAMEVRSKEQKVDFAVWDDMSGEEI